jgi:hypothetical protein
MINAEQCFLALNVAAGKTSMEGTAALQPLKTLDPA